MRVSRILFFVLIIAFFSSIAALAESGKFGFVNSLRIRTEYKEFADAQEKFDKDVAMWQAELDSMNGEVDSLESELEKQSLLLSEERRREKENIMKDKKLKYKQYSTEILGPGGKIERRNAELVKPIYDKIMLVLEKIGRGGNYTFIFDSVGGNIAYADKKLDLTDRVLEELNKLENR